jgi:hypothetical protein
MIFWVSKYKGGGKFHLELDFVSRLEDKWRLLELRPCPSFLNLKEVGFHY